MASAIAASSAQSQVEPTKTFYVPTLDGLRAVACCMVLFHHLSPETITRRTTPLGHLWGTLRDGVGAYGVTLFFCLSSFLITSLLMREKEQFGKVDVRAFYIRRILRIWPLYFLLVAGGFFVSQGLNPEPLTPEMIFRFVTFSANFKMATGIIPIYIGALWSVCVEEQFYLVWPWVAKFLDKGAITFLAFILIQIGTVARMHLIGSPWQNTLWYNSLAHLDCFGYGALVALYLHKPPKHPHLVAAAGFIGMIAIEWFFPLKANLVHAIRESGAIGYGATCLLCALIVWAVAGMNSGALTTKGVVTFGKLTFGIYCYHSFLTSFWMVFMDRTDAGPFAAAVLASTMIVAFLSYRYFESPFLNLKIKLQKVHSGAV